jgi:biopolymer transport protein TolQ
VKGVMLGLASASLWSWAVIIEKTFRIGAAQREADRFEGEVAEGRSLDELAKAAGEAPRHALPIMLQTALREWRDARGKAQLTETQTNLVILRVDRALEGVVTRETGRLENGLGVLAIVATSSPFIGLFGTVWGIMTAFQAIAVQKNTNLTVVAPSIAQALFATAIGLAAAIPAYIAYNKFSGDVAKFTDRLEAFANDLAVAVARRLGDKAGG